MTRPRLVLCLGLAALLAACSAAPDVVTKLPTPNPNPVERYRVTVEVSNAPGEFESAEGRVHFQVTKDTMSCIPRAEFSGAPLVAYAGLEEAFPLRKTGPTTFEGFANIDQFVPNDDYGLGPCEWRPFLLSARLSNGVNVHRAMVDPTDLPVESTDRLADGLYRGRSAFNKELFRRNKRVQSSPEPAPDDPLALFSGTQEDGTRPIRSEFFDNYYFIGITAERLEHTP